MKEPRYMVFSGYYFDPKSDPPTALDWFYPIWRKHNFRGFEHWTIANSQVPETWTGVWLSGNLGACGGVIGGKQPFFMPGCPCVWMIAAWIAYGSECDFIYIEQDCLAFGPWVQQMYRDLGDKQAVFGTSQAHGVATSLFLIRHRYIPAWVRDYLLEGPEDVPGRIAELKVKRMMERRPEDYAKLSFGFDTDRPFHIGLPVFYVQKLTPIELNALRASGRVSFSGDIPDVKVFSNH